MIGLLPFGRVGVLKKFFIAASRRGRGGPATMLLESLLKQAGELDLTDIVLDTPSVADRSHASYARDGFDRTTAADLLLGYLYPDRASVIFRRRLVRSDPPST